MENLITGIVCLCVCVCECLRDCDMGIIDVGCIYSIMQCLDMHHKYAVI